MDDFNAKELAAGRLTMAHVRELVTRFQRDVGLAPDGDAGARTRAALELLRGRLPGPTPLSATEDGLTIDAAGWLVGEGVVKMPIDPSWYYKRLGTSTGFPKAIVAHYTATPHGTARGMARHRANHIDLSPVDVDGDGVDRQASWHVSVDGDGTIVQMAPFTVGCWHAGGPTAKPIAGLGGANRCAVGVELVGDGSSFPPEQVTAATRVWRALVQKYGIARDRAMVQHSELDPTRKRDPGPVWMRDHAAAVLDAAFAP